MIQAELDPNAVTVPLDMTQVFSRQGPVHVEIGSGKGRFLLELANARPDESFLGIERSRKYHRMVCDKVARRGIDNVRLMQTTAEDLLFRLLMPSTITAMYVLFPDPWPKKRHHKRRLMTLETAAAMAEALVPEGILHIKSDHKPYAKIIAPILEKTPMLDPLKPEEIFENLPLTGFECKYIQEGRPIYAFAAQKRASEQRTS